MSLGPQFFQIDHCGMSASSVDGIAERCGEAGTGGGGESLWLSTTGEGGGWSSTSRSRS